jgi:transposase
MKLTVKQRAVLLSNPNVLQITKSNVEYTPEFKLEAIEAYQSGLTAEEVFEEYGFDTSIYLNDYCSKAIKRWILKLAKYGEDSFFEQIRGKGATGRPKNIDTANLSMEEMKALLDIQQGVIEELKKRHALARKK